MTKFQIKPKRWKQIEFTINLDDSQSEPFTRLIKFKKVKKSCARYVAIYIAFVHTIQCFLNRE